MKSWKPWFQQKVVFEQRRRATQVCAICGMPNPESSREGQPVHQACVDRIPYDAGEAM